MIATVMAATMMVMNSHQFTVWAPLRVWLSALARVRAELGLGVGRAVRLAGERRSGHVGATGAQA
jgi:hypothetical protein